MVTDYDSWHLDFGTVDVSKVIKTLHDNAERAKCLVSRLAQNMPKMHENCPIGSDRALDFAIITSPEFRDSGLLAKLDAVAGRVLKS
jgi:5'-methylthioadenosine phosphorylase